MGTLLLALGRHTPIFLGFSPAATFKTIPIVRQLPLQGRDAWQPSIVSAGSSQSTLHSPRLQLETKKGAPMADGIVTLTSSTFDETVNGSSKPILVDFWAEWCGPCKMIAPILAEIAVEQKDSLVISKLNVDEHGDIAQRYNVMSIPTLLLFNNGELVKRLVGAKGKGALLQELSEFLTPSL
jgi:thioredoxin 1